MSLSESNPYEVLHDDIQTFDRGHDMVVDGQTLWVRPVSTLPARCIYTNQPGQPADYVVQQLTWKGKSFRMKLRAKTVTLNAVVTPALRRLTVIRRLRAIPITAFVVFFLTQPKAEWLIGSAAVLTLLEVGWYLWSNSLGYSELSVVEEREGFFQIRGLGKEFLTSLEAELAVQEHQAEPVQDSQTAAI